MFFQSAFLIFVVCDDSQFDEMDCCGVKLQWLSATSARSQRSSITEGNTYIKHLYTWFAVAAEENEGVVVVNVDVVDVF